MLPLACSCAFLPKTGEKRGDDAPHYKVGKPYKIQGVWYYPEEKYDYDEVGIASWYGDDFHGKLTANGERFDMNALTAAHRTLPLPSMVQITNLENGRSVTLRVNDRGPFVGNRIIDLSRRAAQLLGFQSRGTTKVRVRVLPEESMAMAARLKGGRKYAAKKVSVTEVDESSLSQPSEPPPQDLFITTGNELFVQVGAFLQRANADKLLETLKQSGFGLARKFNNPDDDLIRVRFGPFRALGEAKKLLSEVIKKGYSESRLVVAIP